MDDVQALPRDLADLKSTCDQLAEYEEEMKALLAVREGQFTEILAKNTYTQNAIAQAMGLSRSRFSQLLKKLRDKDVDPEAAQHER